MTAYRVMTRLAFVPFVIWPTNLARGQDGGQDTAISRLPALVRSVTRDTQLPNSPVIELHLEGMGPRAFGDKVVKLLNQFPELRGLRLQCRITDAAIDELCQLRNLSALELAVCDVTDKGLAKLATLEQLTHLRLTLCPKIIGDGIASLTRLKELRIFGCHNITRLRIAPLHDLTYVGIHLCDGLTGTALTELKDLPILTNLKLLECRKIVDPELHVVKALRNLRHLSLTFHYEVADAGLTNVSDLRDLKSLSLRGKLIPDPGLADLGRLRTLTSVTISSFTVTNAGIGVLGNLPNLAAVTLRCNKVDIAGLHVFRELPHLTSLEFDECWEFSDAEIASISECKHLKNLLCRPETGDEGVARQISLPRHSSIWEFKNALPSTEIIWQKATLKTAGAWRLESISPRASRDLPEDYPVPYDNDAVVLGESL